MTRISRFLTKKLRLKVNETKSAVARPEERKFLGFSISNDGSKRRIAPKALERFKTRIRDMTRRTRGISLPQLIEELTPYLIGWRGYFGFCQTPRVLTILEAWIRRRLRCIFGGSGERTIASRNCAAVAYQSSMRRSPPVRQPVSGACPDTRPSNKALRNHYFDSLGLPRHLCSRPSLTQSNRRVRDPYARWCGRGGTVRCPPIPIFGATSPSGRVLAKDRISPIFAVRHSRRDEKLRISQPRRDDFRARSGRRWPTDPEACRRSGVNGWRLAYVHRPPNRAVDPRPCKKRWVRIL